MLKNIAVSSATKLPRLERGTVQEMADHFTIQINQFCTHYWEGDRSEVLDYLSVQVGFAFPDEEIEYDTGTWVTVNQSASESVENQLDDAEINSFLDMFGNLFGEETNTKVQVWRHDANFTSKGYVESKPIDPTSFL